MAESIQPPREEASNSATTRASVTVHLVPCLSPCVVASGPSATPPKKGDIPNVVVYLSNFYGDTVLDSLLTCSKVNFL